LREGVVQLLELVLERFFLRRGIGVRIPRRGGTPATPTTTAALGAATAAARCRLLRDVAGVSRRLVEGIQSFLCPTLLVDVALPCGDELGDIRVLGRVAALGELGRRLPGHARDAVVEGRALDFFSRRWIARDPYRILKVVRVLHVLKE